MIPAPNGNLISQTWDVVYLMTRNENIAILHSFLAAGDGALKLGKYASAEHFYQASLRFANRHLGPDIPETALANFSLSMYYLDRRKLDDAASHANTALRMFIGIFGNDHPTTAMALHQLAEVCQAQNLPQVAKPIRRRAGAILVNHMLVFQSRLVRTNPDDLKAARLPRAASRQDGAAFRMPRQMKRLIISEN